MSALLEVQQGLYQALSSNAALMSKISGIYEYDPANQSYPYIVIGEGKEAPLNTFEQSAMEVVVTARIYSEAASYSEGLEILAMMNQGLKETELPLERLTLVSSHYLGGETVVEEENSASRKVEAVYRFVVQR